MSKSPEQVVAEALEAALRATDGYYDGEVIPQAVVAALREAGMLTERIEVTDEMADAAAQAMHNHLFGPDVEPLNHRDLGIRRIGYKVAIKAALDVAITDREGSTERGKP